MLRVATLLDHRKKQNNLEIIIRAEWKPTVAALLSDRKK